MIQTANELIEALRPRKAPTSLKLSGINQLKENGDIRTTKILSGWNLKSNQEEKGTIEIIH